MKKGEFVTVLGPNGAGKTTLLKLLALLYRPTGGELYLDGKRSQHNEELRRTVGVLSHHTFLYENLTALENLQFYGKMYGLPRLEERIEAVLQEVGLEYAWSDPVRTFSRGMQQRLALARAILHEPSLLLLDEPYSGLDQQAITILNNVLRQSVQKKRTMFLVTHHYEQGLELSERILILYRGKVVYDAGTAGLTPVRFKELYLQHVGGRP